MDVVKMMSQQNHQKYKISEKYSVGFYILAGYAIFRYYEKREYGTWETDRDSVLERLSDGERKILSDFEAEKKERISNTGSVWHTRRRYSKQNKIK